jgi:glycolate oxidase iron-sulfur subunit
MIDQFPPKKYDAIISNAGGCGSHLRHYSRLLADDPQYAEVSKIWDSKLRDIHEWLAEIGCRAPLPSNESSMVVTYHESCHLAHGQKIRLAPVSLLRLIPCVSLVELNESAWCCGSAGVYSITQPETSDVLLDRKVRHILATGASILATSNPGCHLQIERGLRAAGSEIEILQPVTLLARAYRREQTSSQTL